MITQEFLSQCSDEQINKGVAWIEAKKSNISNRHLCSWPIINEQVSWCGRYFKPSSYPSDIMLIAERYCMSIEFPHPDLGDTGQVSVYIPNDTDIYVEFNDSSRYMRAICEVYILMSVNK